MGREWKSVREYLPEGWEEAAKEQGALQRSRSIQTAEDLLALNLLYVTEAGSFQGASTLMSLTADIRLNKNAARKRIQRSWKWLRWMAKGTCQREGFLLRKPCWLGERRVILIDASDMALSGSHSSDYRLHYAFDLFGFSCQEMEVTAVQEGEKLTGYSAKPGDIIIADRIYCTIKGMEHVLEQSGSFVLRMKHQAFILYDENGQRIELLEKLRKLKEWETVSLQAFYRLETGCMRPIRIVATRKDEETARKSQMKRERTAKRKQQAASEAAAEMAGYIVLATNLDDEDARVLELYRARWQIEQVFYRLKGLFAFGEVPSRNPDSSRAWFYAKLLLAALCESMVKDLSFSPAREYPVMWALTDLLYPVDGPQPMA